jgi:hypothetical protein
VHRPKDVQNNYGMPKGLKHALQTFCYCICDGYDHLAVPNFSLLCKTSVYQQVFSDSFTRKLLNITINRANILVFNSLDCYISPMQSFRGENYQKTDKFQGDQLKRRRDINCSNF